MEAQEEQLKDKMCFPKVNFKKNNKKYLEKKKEKKSNYRATGVL